MQTDAGAVPGTTPAADGEAFLRVRGLTKHFDITGGLVPRILYGRKVVHAVENVSFDLAEGETLGLVGESGSGKSTAARVIARLIPATAGDVYIGGHDVLRAGPAEMKAIRKDVQFVFQDPFSSLNPRMRIEQLIGRSLKIHFNMGPAERRERVVELMEQVGLRADHIYRYPHEFSGGQRQRIAIARALASEPTMILADEPASSLDVSIQAQVLELLDGLRQRLGLTMIFITHDLNVAEFVSDQVAVMYGG
ncbi:MAG: ABC transporter ATP-binding protein, partial [Chloroflexi bacterium]|nr:ABC transporter ATP-binding protein [Chloroflexota bacterium]